MKLLCFFGAHERAFPGSNLTCRRTFESHHLGDLQRSTGGQLPPRPQQKLQYPQRCIAAENTRNHHLEAYHIPSYTHGFYPGMWSHHQAAATENKHLEHNFNWSPVQWGWYYIYNIYISYISCIIRTCTRVCQKKHSETWQIFLVSKLQSITPLSPCSDSNIHNHHIPPQNSGCDKPKKSTCQQAINVYAAQWHIIGCIMAGTRKTCVGNRCYMFFHVSADA